MDSHSSGVDVAVAGFESFEDSAFLSICILPCAETDGRCKEALAKHMYPSQGGMLTDLGPSIEGELGIERSHCSCSESYLVHNLRETRSCGLGCSSEHWE